MNMTGITLCMIVRDEENCLERCLSSAAGIVSEMIVVDTGSNDRSPEIAARYGATVLSIPWTHDFAQARNAGLERATQPWILVLDADEEIAAPAPEYLHRLLDRKESNGYFVKLINYVGSSGSGEYVTDSVCRLFRNDPRIRYSGPIHEEVVASIQAISNQEIEHSEIVVRHYGYLDEVIAGKKKNKRNLALIREILKKHPDDTLMQYALGTEYFQREDYRTALPIFEALIPRIPVNSGYASDLILKTAFSLKETGAVREALQLIDKGLVFYPDFTDMLELKAAILLELDHYQDALTILSQAIRSGDTSYKYTSFSGSGTYRAHYLAGFACERLFLWERACHHYQAALVHNPGYLPAWQRWPAIAFLFENGESDLSGFAAKHRDRIPKSVWNLLLQIGLNGHRRGFVQNIVSMLGMSQEDNHCLQALLLAQSDQDDLAVSRLENDLAGNGSRVETHLYLWALSLKANDNSAAIRHIEQLSVLDPAFSSVEKMLKGAGETVVSEAACRRCQQALIQVRAWNGFVRFQTHLPASLPWSWLPVHMLTDVSGIPVICKQTLLQLCEEKKDQMVYPEMLWTGILAYVCGALDTACNWFEAARAKSPNRIEPYIGLSHLWKNAALNVNAQRSENPLSDYLRFLAIAAV